MTTFEKITALLDQHQASYRVVEHAAVGQTDLINQMQMRADADAWQCAQPSGQSDGA